MFRDGAESSSTELRSVKRMGAVEHFISCLSIRESQEKEN